MLMRRGAATSRSSLLVGVCRPNLPRTGATPPCTRPSPSHPTLTSAGAGKQCGFGCTDVMSRWCPAIHQSCVVGEELGQAKGFGFVALAPSAGWVAKA
jgi:hypothetical protein